MTIQYGSASDVDAGQVLDFFDKLYNTILEDKLKTEQTFNKDTLAGKIRGIIEAFNNPVGFLIVISIIYFIFRK